VSGPLVAVRATIDCGLGLARSVASESWLSTLQTVLREGRGPSRRLPAVAAAVRVSPTMRAQLEAEIGEGGTLEQVGARLDLGRDLDVAIVGLVSTHQQAMDLAARLSAALREQRNRPLVLVLGLQSILDGVRLDARENRVEGRLSIPEDQRAEIVDRMALVAEQIARRRASTAGSGESSPKEPSDEAAESEFGTPAAHQPQPRASGQGECARGQVHLASGPAVRRVG